MELLVVCAIIVLITSAILANDSKLGGRVTLENLAYNIALTVRQAQQYGIAQQRASTNNFTLGFGVSFALANPTSYVLFSDTITDNGVYEQGEAIAPSPYTLTNGYSIVDLCVLPTVNGTQSCAANGVSRIDVVYQRPNPDAYISVNGTPCIQNKVISTANCMYSGSVKLRSPRGDLINVVIMSDGQITLQ